ncbi:hypothetical protein J4E80_003258 [Alternaria sp. BMP 0032]|nr:hypothetical protein J4E80_003258 [Alternaria sp. BMP 0032]
MQTVTNDSVNPGEGRQAWPVTLPAAGGARWKVPPNSVFFSTKPKAFKFGFLHIRKDPLQDFQNELGVTIQDYPREQHTFAVDDGSVTKYSNEIVRQLNRCGLTATDIDLQLPTALQDLEIRDLEAALQTTKDNAYDLVILMLPKPNVGIYSRFKTLAERASGLQSVVVVSKFSAPDKNYLLAECITNIMMKINLKLGGFTHSVEDVQSCLSQQDVMVLGADVVHAGPSAFDGCPSIASIVGSVDYSAGRCLGSARLQRIEKEAKDDKGNAKLEQITDREIIQEVEAMVTERLEDWIRHSEKKTPPKNILYYRDGVSATQYEQVKLKELQAIRDAYSKLANKFGTTSEVGLTAVVVTKRHHTRFYPMSHKLPDPSRGEKKPTYPDRDAFGNYNTKPGLFVDQLVTSPYYQDFFLQSHSAIKGTAKPTHYFILEAGIEGLDLEKLRDLTHAICFSYVRGTVGVSYASPTYYADRLCERSRTYMRRYFVKTEDVTGPSNLEAALTQEKHRLERDYTTLLDSLYPRNRQFADKKDEKKHFKDRKATEADHRKEIVLGLRRFVFEKVEDDFYKFKDQTVDGKPWLNPWDPCLRDTMFWM